MSQQAPAASGSAVEDRSTTYKGTPAGSETVPGGTLMIAAYLVVWFVVLLLVLRTFQRQTALAKKVDDLERLVRSGPAKP